MSLVKYNFLLAIIFFINVAFSENIDTLKIENFEKLFSSEIYGLTRFEPQFKLLNVEESDFISIIRRHKNIIILTDKYSTKKVNNVWSKNQIVWYLDYNDINFNQKINEQILNPVWHIHNGKPPKEKIVMPFSMLLNIVGSSNAKNKDILWKFIKKFHKLAS